MWRLFERSRAVISSWPILSAVQNADDVEDIARDLVNNYVRQRSKHKFAGS
jgi:hypothetical protein